MSGPGQGVRRFCERYPQVWHVIEAEGEPLARAIGLRPASRLRALAGLPSSTLTRDAFEWLTLNGGTAILRFQQMRNARLAPTLHGRYAARPDLWRAMVDEHVFFWAAEGRLARFLKATKRERQRAEPGAPDPVVLPFQTARLLAKHAAVALYTTVNSGSTAGRGRARRDERTFRPVASYLHGSVAELAIPGTVRMEEGLIGSAGP